MQRFFFDVVNGHGLVVDEEGQYLPDPEQARIEALLTAHGIADDEMLEGFAQNVVVKVRDDGGAKIFEVTLSVASSWTPGFKSERRAG